MTRTPGPWIVVRRENLQISDANRTLILAYIPHPACEEDEENAAMLASAPIMYDALIHISAVLKIAVETQTPAPLSDVSLMIEMANKGIAAADGEP